MADDQQYPTRRHILAGAGLLGAATLTGCSLNQGPEVEEDHHGFSQTSPKTADEALARLIAGNRCFTSEHFDVANRRRSSNRRQEVAAAQHPYAVILCCADSRISPEIIFTAGLGDLFVVRVAGNIVSSQCLGVLGSIEYAIAELRIPLILVLGHKNCGAIKATVEFLKTGISPPGTISIITDAIRPAIESVADEPGNLLDNIVVANVHQSVANLVGSADIIAPAIAASRLKVLGGVYDLANGQVQLFP